jgi:hypothetical protein
MTSPAASILILGFGMGMLHALDPDHLLTVANLSGSGERWKSAVHYCAHWALGHGGALLGIGLAVLLLGAALPGTLSRAADHLVGLVLLVMGLLILWRLFKLHRLPPSSSPAVSYPPKQGRRVGALAMGMLHGTAGSAPLLAIAPLPALHDPWLGMAYLLIFACGVLSAMLGIGATLGLGMRHVQQRTPWLIGAVRASLACGASAVGLQLLAG